MSVVLQSSPCTNSFLGLLQVREIALAIDQAELGHTGGHEKHQGHVGSWLSGLSERTAYTLPASLWSPDTSEDQQVTTKTLYALCFSLPSSSFALDLLHLTQLIC